MGWGVTKPSKCPIFYLLIFFIYVFIDFQDSYNLQT